MSFVHPEILALTGLIVPLLTLFLWWAWRKRQELIASFVRSRLLAHLTIGVSRTRQKLRLALLVAAVAFALGALARPQWGFTWEEVKQKGLDIVLLIDTSRSMLAEDTKPNRLSRAKLAALDFIPLAKTDRLGLVAFAGTAFLQCPLTLDNSAFRQTVEALDDQSIPQGGTALSEAIDTARQAFKNDEDTYNKVMVILSDGEDHESGAVRAAEKAAAAGIYVFAVGIGTLEGDLLRQTQTNGVRGKITDADGREVKSRLNEDLLQKVAAAGNGFYLRLTGAKTMETLFERGLAPLLPKLRSLNPKARTDPGVKIAQRPKERFQFPLAVTIVLLLLELFFPERRLVWRSNAPAPGTASSASRGAATLGVLLLLWLPVAALGSASSALRSYETGQYESARREYQRLLENRPGDARLQYNAGAAAYQAKHFESAARHFTNALTSADLTLQQHAYYNLGNTLFRLGEEAKDPAARTQTWEQSVRSYEGALHLDPKDADAQHNLGFVKKKLEELRQQQPKSQDSKPDQKQDSAKDQDQQQQQSSAKQDQQNQQEQKSESQPKPSPEEQKDQAKAGDEKKEEQGQPPPQAQQPKPDNKKASQASEASPKPGEEKESGEAAETATPPGQMTRRQAVQLLDVQKEQEKAYPFKPPTEKARPRGFKDW